jgi:hypothetical protein
MHPQQQNSHKKNAAFFVLLWLWRGSENDANSSPIEKAH